MDVLSASIVTSAQKDGNDQFGIKDKYSRVNSQITSDIIEVV